MTKDEIIANCLLQLITTAFNGIAVYIYRVSNVKFSKRDPKKSRNGIYWIFATWLLCNVTGFYITFVQHAPWWILGTSLLLSTGALFWYIHNVFMQFRQTGLIGIDRRIESGIDYKRSLELTQNSLKFLGIGAGKLTNFEKEFEDAVARCSKLQKPVKLLLLSPENSNLTISAQQAKKPVNEYKHIVRESLRKIARLKKDRALKIEVRFYPESPRIEPIFRLMLIDDSLCLVSFNVWADGDGSGLPQLHIVNDMQEIQTVRSFYYPFDRYFDSLWELSKEWNFEDHLTETKEIAGTERE